MELRFPGKDLGPPSGAVLAEMAPEHEMVVRIPRRMTKFLPEVTGG